MFGLELLCSYIASQSTPSWLLIKNWSTQPHKLANHCYIMTCVYIYNYIILYIYVCNTNDLWSFSVMFSLKPSLFGVAIKSRCFCPGALPSLALFGPDLGLWLQATQKSTKEMKYIIEHHRTRTTMHINSQQISGSQGWSFPGMLNTQWGALGLWVGPSSLLKSSVLLSYSLHVSWMSWISEIGCLLKS